MKPASSGPVRPTKRLQWVGPHRVRARYSVVFVDQAQRGPIREAPRFVSCTVFSRRWHVWPFVRVAPRISRSSRWSVHHLENPQGPPHRPSTATVRCEWTQFLRSQAALACDFATVDTVMLHRYYLLCFIGVTSREVFCAGITTNPTGPWTTQAARNRVTIATLDDTVRYRRRWP